MRRINFLLIGTGQIAETHIAAIKSVSGADLYGVFSPSGYRRACALAKRHKTRAFRTFDEALRDKNIAAVDIVTKNFLHAPLGIKAASFGKHVLTEKPIATTMQEADRLIIACRKNKVKLSVIFQNRFSPAYIDLKKKIDKGQLGRINLALFSWILRKDKSYFEFSPWRGRQKEAGGGFLIMNAIHYIDILQWMLGPVSAVKCETGKFKFHRNEVEDSAWAVLKFKSGAKAIICGTTAAAESQPPRLEVIGEQGNIAIADNSGIISDKKYFAAQIKDFVSSINNKRTPAIDGEEARKSLAVVLALYRSARIKKEIKI